MLVKNLNLIYYIFFTFVNVFLCLLFQYLDDVSSYIYLISIIICVGYVLSIYALIKLRGIMSLTTLFWACLGLFGVSRLFLYLFGVFDFMKSPYSIIGIFYWDYETAVIVLNYYFIFMAIFTNIVLHSNYYRKKNRIENRIENRYEGEADKEKYNSLVRIRKIIYTGFFISAPIVAVYYFIQALVVLRLGYTSLYNNEAAQYLSFGPLLSIARFCFTITFYSICSMEVREKYFRISMFVYLVVNAIPLFQGSRAIFIISLLAILFIYYQKFGKVIKGRWIIFGGALGIPLLEIIGYIRSNIKITPISFFSSYKDFIINLSSSLNVPAYYIQHKAELSENSYPYILEPIFRVFQYFKNIQIYSSGQSLEMIAVRFNLGHQITNNISTGYYLAGSNVASNFIAEMSEFGLLGVLFFSVIISKLIVITEEKIVNRNIFFTFMTIEFTKWILFIPRAETIYDTYSLLKYSLSFAVIYLLSIVIGKTKGGQRYEL